MPFGAAGLSSTMVDEIVPIKVGDGCLRRDLPSRPGVRVWVVDIAPGASWPHVDEHGSEGEDIFVAEGELIEGEKKFAAGTFVHFAPGSHHRPRSETGVRLFGFNLKAHDK